MSSMEFLSHLRALPEMWVLLATCVVMILDLYSRDEQRRVAFYGAQAIVGVAFLLTLYVVYESEGTRQIIFNGMYVSDVLGHLLKLVCYVATSAALVYSHQYLADRGLLRGEFVTLLLFSLLGMMVMISAASFLTLFVGLELMSLCLYALVALNRDSLTGAADALQVGDCFDRPEETDSITEIQHRPCSTAHDAEVIHNFTSPEGPDAPYPVISGFDDFVLENCVPVFESYVGRDWETDTDLNIGWLAPTLSGWTGDDHDRGFTCYVFRLDEGKLYGSVKNVGASPLVTQSP